MNQGYPVALRERVVAAYERGDGSYREVSLTFQLGEATVKRWVWQSRREGHVRPRKRGGGTPSDICLLDLEAIVTRLGDANAGEIAAEYNRSRRGKNRRHASSIKRALHRAGYVVKKNAFARKNSYDQTSQKSVRSSGEKSAAFLQKNSFSWTNRASTRR